MPSRNTTQRVRSFVDAGARMPVLIGVLMFLAVAFGLWRYGTQRSDIRTTVAVDSGGILTVEDSVRAPGIEPDPAWSGTSTLIEGGLKPTTILLCPAPAGLSQHVASQFRITSTAPSRVQSPGTVHLFLFNQNDQTAKAIFDAQQGLKIAVPPDAAVRDLLPVDPTRVPPFAATQDGCAAIVVINDGSIPIDSVVGRGQNPWVSTEGVSDFFVSTETYLLSLTRGESLIGATRTELGPAGMIRVDGVSSIFLLSNIVRAETTAATMVSINEHDPRPPRWRVTEGLPSRLIENALQTLVVAAVGFAVGYAFRNSSSAGPPS